MAKEVLAKVKLQIPGGVATPAPPVGPALGQHGVNIGQFVQQFNQRTSSAQGTIIPVEVTIYADRSFEFVTKQPPAAVLIKKAAGIAKGSGTAGRESAGTITAKQLEEIARQKMPDLNASSLERAMEIIRGTARSVGVKVEG